MSFVAIGMNGDSTPDFASLAPDQQGFPTVTPFQQQQQQQQQQPPPVAPPIQPQPQAPTPAPQPKQYWQVLDEYKRMTGSNPVLKGMPIEEWSQNMNNITGTNQYNEGLTNNSGLRQLGGGLEEAIHHFGGAPAPPSPPGTPWWQAQSLSDVFGQGTEGWDLPALAHRGTAAVARRAGAGEGLSEALGKGAEQFTEALPAVGAAALVGAAAPPAAGFTVPAVLGGTAALQTYGETGKVIPAAIAGVASAAIPKIMDVAGQTALRLAGAPTWAEALGGSLNTLPEGSKLAEDLSDRYVAQGWGPTALLQRGARIGGANVGMLGQGVATEAAQTLVDPTKSWEDKLSEIGSEFSPGHLLASAVGNLPFSLLDVMSERTNPARNLSKQLDESFMQRFAAGYAAHEQMLTGEAKAPTKSETTDALQRVKTGKVTTPEQNTILKSIGQAPVTIDKSRQFMTTEGRWSVGEAMDSAQDRANQILTARGTNLKVTESDSLSLYQAVQETEAMGRMPKETLTHIAASKLVNRYFGIKEDLQPFEEVREPPPYGAGRQVDTKWTNYDEQRQMDERIAKATTVGDPTYNKILAQKMALVESPVQLWADHGITGPVMMAGEESGVTKVNEPGSAPQQVSKRGALVPLDRNIVDKVTGLKVPGEPGAATASDLAISKQRELEGLNNEYWRLVQQGTPVQDRKIQDLRTRMLDLEKHIKALGSEVSARRTSATHPYLTGDAVAAGRYAALNYPESKFDINDPNSVRDFVDHIGRVMARAEEGYYRSRGEQHTVSDESGGVDGPPLKLGKKEALDLEQALQLANPNKRVYNFFVPRDKLDNPVPEADGTYRVKRQEYNSFYSYHPNMEGGPLPSEDEEAAAPVPDELQVKHEEQQHEGGVNIGDVTALGNMEDEKIMALFDKGIKEKDPATLAGRRASLAKNVTMYVQSLKDRDLQYYFKENWGVGIQNIAQLKEQFVGLINFLRDGGQIKLQYESRRPGKLSIQAVGDLDGLNRYLNQWGLGNKLREVAPGSNKSPETGFLFNRRQGNQPNFFERWYMLSKHLQAVFVDPRRFNADFEARPPGGGKTYPWPTIYKEAPEKVIALTRLPVDSILQARGGYVKTGEFTETGEAKEGVVPLFNADGTLYGKYAVEYNPIETTILKGIQHQAYTNVGSFFDMLKNYTTYTDPQTKEVKSQFNDYEKSQIALAQSMMDQMPYLRNMKLGFAASVDGVTKGYTHVDHQVSSAGMVLSPFVSDSRSKSTLRLMTPQELLPHYMNEIGHVATNFAYYNNPEFKAEVDRIFNHLRDVHKGMVDKTGGPFFKVDLNHALSRPEELLASMFGDGNNSPELQGQFHKWLQSIDDPFPSLPWQRGTGSIFDRIIELFRNLFSKFHTVGTNNMLDRMTQLAARGFEISKDLPLQYKGDIYNFLHSQGRIRGLIVRGYGDPPTGAMGEPYTARVVNPEFFAREITPPGLPPTPLEGAAGGSVPALTQRVTTIEGQLRQARNAEARGEPNEAKALEATLRNAQQDLVNNDPSGMTREVLWYHQRDAEYAWAHAEWMLSRLQPYVDRLPQQVDLWRQRSEMALGMMSDIQKVMDGIEGKVLALRQAPEGEVLQSRESDWQHIDPPKPIMKIAGGKMTLLRDPVVNNIVRGFVAGHDVLDAFSGPGQLSQFAKAAGAKTVTMNVFSPQMHSLYNTIKNNPESFAARVAAAVARIDAPRTEIPRMRDGSDLKVYLDGLEPNVGLFIKQNLNLMGREVAAGEKFTPSVTTTNAGLRDLPDRVRGFSGQIDNVSQGDGWQTVANAQRGQRVMVDPPYVNSRGYGPGGAVSVDQRLAEYEKHLYPAVERGARFTVFDIADPALMKSLTQHGFMVQPVQRIQRTSTSQPEFVAYNHVPGEVLESRISPVAVQDSMSHASLSVNDEPDRLVFFPMDPGRFGNIYGSVFGERMQPVERAGQIGFSVPKVGGFDTLTQEDMHRIPVPAVKSYLPTSYQMLKDSYMSDHGASEVTADALALWGTRYASLLKNSGDVYWGRLTPEQAQKDGGLAWFEGRVAGVDPRYPQRELEGVVRHESTHLSGIAKFNLTATPDAKAAMDVLIKSADALTPDGRRSALMALSLFDPTGKHWVPESAVDSPSEFGAVVMEHVGDVIGTAPQPSAYLRDLMRFLPDEYSNLFQIHTMRKLQGLDRLVALTEQSNRQYGTKDPTAQVLADVWQMFKGLTRSALEINDEQSKFMELRMIYPDSYKPLLEQMTNAAVAKGKQIGMALQPAGEVLESRGRIEDMIRGFFPLPDSEGRLPTKLSWWDRNLTQYPQFTDKYPVLRPHSDMLNTEQGMLEVALMKNNAALAGVYQKGSVEEDARTKQLSTFLGSARYNKIHDDVARDIQAYGDAKHNAEYARAGGDVFAMNPQEVTGWLTEGFKAGLIEKYGGKDPTMRKIVGMILQGENNQYKAVNAAMVDGQIHQLHLLVGEALVRHNNMTPEQARAAVQPLIDALKTRNDDPISSNKSIAEFRASVGDDKLFGSLIDMAETQWNNIQRMERFLEIRQGYFMSEKRIGQFAVYWRGPDGKILSHFEPTGAKRDAYIASHPEITPVRTTNPSDVNWGATPEMLDVMRLGQERMQEKLQAIFGKDRAAEMYQAMDLVTELTNNLNARDVLRLTTRRDLAPGREELNMFEVTQHYLKSMYYALRNRAVRSETSFMLADPAFVNEPNLKDYANAQTDAALAPDKPLGRWMQKLGFLYYLFANPSSMIMQLSHQVMGLAPKLTSLGQNPAQSFNIIKNANEMVVKSFRKGYDNPDIQAAVDRAKESGVIGSWLARDIDHSSDLSLTNRIRASEGKPLWDTFNLLKNKTYQGFNLMRKLYDIIPTYNSEVAFVSSLLHFQSEAGGKLTGEDLYREASHLVGVTMYRGGKINRPGVFQWMPRSAAQGLWNLQTYANGLTTMMGELIRKSINPTGLTPAQARQTRIAAAQMLMTQTAVAGVLGLPFAQAALYALQKLFPEVNVEQAVRNTLAGLMGDDEQMGNVFSNSLVTGIPSAMPYAPDVGSRFALAGVFHVSPYSGVGWEQLAGPTGGLLSRAIDAAQAGIRGDPMQSAQDLMPNGFRRIWQTLEQGKTYRTANGQLLADNLTPEEVAARIIGFGPARIARLQDYERLVKVEETAEKAGQAHWTQDQVRLMQDNRDDEVQRNIADRVATTKGTHTAAEMGTAIGKEYERQTMPTDLKKFGNRATILAQKRLQGTLGTQDLGPSSIDRLNLQRNIAARLGLRGPTMGSYKHAAGVDQLLSLYPNLTDSQASVLLSHAAGSRPSPDLYSELLGGGE